MHWFPGLFSPGGTQLSICVSLLTEAVLHSQLAMMPARRASITDNRVRLLGLNAIGNPVAVYRRPNMLILCFFSAMLEHGMTLHMCAPGANCWSAYLVTITDM